MRRWLESAARVAVMYVAALILLGLGGVWFVFSCWIAARFGGDTFVSRMALYLPVMLAAVPAAVWLLAWVERATERLFK